MIDRLGIRARVTLVAVLPTLVLAVLLTAFYATARFADFESNHLSRGNAFARQLVASSEYAVFSGNREALQQLTASLLREEGVLGVTVFDDQGNALASSGNLSTAAALAPSPTLSSTLRHDKVLRIVEPIRPVALELDDTLPDGEALYANPAVAETFGYVVLDLSLAGLQRQRANLLATGSATVAAVLLAALLLALYMGRSVSAPIREIAHSVQRIGRGQFDERVPAWGGGSLRTLSEGVNGMASELAEMHHRMQQRIDDATAELRARKDEAESANMAKSRFLAAASHDLRQPMHALGLFIAELGQQRLAARSRVLLEQITAAAGALETLMDGLLDLSKLDAGVVRPSMRTFSLETLLERIANGQQRIAREAGVTLRVRTLDCRVHTDPVMLERVLLNLIGNAIHHCRKGRVLVACRRRDRKMLIEIRDNGPGIAADAHGIVFQEFVQLNNPGRDREQGLGLGLAIVRRLSDLLQLNLSLRSSPGRGAVFAITLDIVDDGIDAIPSRTDERPLGDLGGLRIVLVENDPLALTAMQSLLESWGCEVLIATQVADVTTAWAGEAAPDVLLSDYRLADGNGLDVIAALRSRYGVHLPAALVSGDTAEHVLTRCQQAGLTLLHKPVRPARLRAFLARSRHPER